MAKKENKNFQLNIQDLTTIIDIDEGVPGKREVPCNMVWIRDGELTKDSGVSVLDNTGAFLVKSLYTWVKPDGTEKLLRSGSTKLQIWDGTSTWSDHATTFTTGKRFGFAEYEGNLYTGNGVEAYQKWTGSAWSTPATGPLGNIFAVFEDRMFVAGNPAAQGIVYFSNQGDADTFTGTDVVAPLGSDIVTGLIAYYDRLIIFKKDSVWSLTFVYDQVTSAYIPKIDLVSNEYGCIGPDAYTWVDNDIWFFTGKDVRSLTLTIRTEEEAQRGAVNLDKLSKATQIKEALKLVNQTYADKACVAFYDNRFFLSVPHNTSTYNNVTYVCDTFQKNQWTKLRLREKAYITKFTKYNKYITTASSLTNGTTYKWVDNQYHDAGVAYTAYVAFKTIGLDTFSTSKVWRYIDLYYRSDPASTSIKIYTDDMGVFGSVEKQYWIQSKNDALPAGEGTWGEDIYGGGELYDESGEPKDIDYLFRRVSLLQKAQSIKIRLENEVINQWITISKMILHFKTRDPRYIDTDLIVQVT